MFAVQTNGKLEILQMMLRSSSSSLFSLICEESLVFPSFSSPVDPLVFIVFLCFSMLALGVALCWFVH